MVKKKVRSHLPQAEKNQKDQNKVQNNNCETMQPPPNRRPANTNERDLDLLCTTTPNVNDETGVLGDVTNDETAEDFYSSYNKSGVDHGATYDETMLGNANNDDANDDVMPNSAEKRPSSSRGKRRRKTIVNNDQHSPDGSLAPPESSPGHYSRRHGGRHDMSPFGKDSIDGLQNEETMQEEDPNWDTITQHPPASKDVPMFLEARERRRALDEKMIERLNDWNESMHNGIDEIGRTLTSIVQAKGEALDDMEEELKVKFVDNEQSRAEMQQKLEQSHREAQSLYASLMMQVLQPISQIGSQMAQGLAYGKK